MPKPTRRSSPSDAPQPSQVAAIRRALAEGSVPQARQRLAALREAFPAFKPLRALAWEVESQAGEPMLAAARAYEWHTVSLSSRSALQALERSAQSAGLTALSQSAQRRQLILEGESELPPLEGFDAPLGRLSFEQAEAIDLSRMHLADGQSDAAATVLRGVEHPSAYNNLALALFAGGQLGPAREAAEAAWRSHPANLFALERVARWRCWAEGLSAGRDYTAALRDTTPLRAEDALARVQTLQFLGETHTARQAAQEAQAATYWDKASTEVRDRFKALVEAVFADAPQGSSDDTTLWFPRTWVRSVGAAARQLKKGLETPGADDAALQARWTGRLKACDAHVDYLMRAAELGGDAVRQLGLSVLKQRAIVADAAAIAALLQLLTRPCGPDAVRTALLNWLVDHKLHPRGAPTDVLAAGQVRTSRSYSLNVHAQTRSSALPQEGQALHARVQQALRRGGLREALELAQQLQDRFPDQPAPLTDLATIKQAMGHAMADIVALYRQAMALAPQDVFARCGLARCLSGLGRTDEARALLDALLAHADWHYREYRCLLLAQRAQAVALHEQETVRVVDEGLKELAERFPPD